eukprot:351018-Chlamydomonas_euryale.AAC.2
MNPRKKFSMHQFIMNHVADCGPQQQFLARQWRKAPSCSLRTRRPPPTVSPSFPHCPNPTPRSACSSQMRRTLPTPFKRPSHSMPPQVRAISALVANATHKAPMLRAKVASNLDTILEGGVSTALQGNWACLEKVVRAGAGFLNEGLASVELLRGNWDLLQAADLEKATYAGPETLRQMQHARTFVLRGLMASWHRGRADRQGRAKCCVWGGRCWEE